MMNKRLHDIPLLKGMLLGTSISPHPHENGMECNTMVSLDKNTMNVILYAIMKCQIKKEILNIK